MKLNINVGAEDLGPGDPLWEATPEKIVEILNQLEDDGFSPMVESVTFVIDVDADPEAGHPYASLEDFRND